MKRPFVPVFCVGVLASCTGTIGQPDPGGVGSNGGSTGAETPPAAGAGGAPGTALCPGQAVRAAPAGLTLLRVNQYTNTVSDLLQFDAFPFVRFSNAGGRKISTGVFLQQADAQERLRTAEGIAAEAASPTRLGALLRRMACDPAVSGNSSCRDRLVDFVGRRAFRKDLDPAERADMVALFDAGLATTGQFASGVEALLAGILQSPELLYQLPVTIGGAAPQGKQVVRLDDYALASRLSYFLWNSMPDDLLLSAAAAGRLGDPKDIEAQVRRMIKTAHAKETRRDLFASWLMLDGLPGVPHSETEFTPNLGADLEASVMAMVDDVYAKSPTMDALLGGNTIFMNSALAALYLPKGTSIPGATFQAVPVDSKQRRGLVTHPALMAMLTNAVNAGRTPIKRGVFIKQRVLCESPPPKPDTPIPALPAVRAGVSNREALEMHRANPTCAACHAYFDPIGFAFESYDGIGRYRTTDRGAPVDASAVVTGTADVNGTFTHGTDFFDQLNKSHAVRGCFARQWYEYALARDLDLSGVDACALGALKERFSAAGDLNDLFVAIATSDTFLNQQIGE